MPEFIPLTISQISDRIGGMVLCMPDMELPHTGLDMAGAYAQLEHSLGLVRAKLGEERYAKLIAMARQSHEHFKKDETKAGRFMLQDMLKVLHNKKTAEELYQFLEKF